MDKVANKLRMDHLKSKIGESVKNKKIIVAGDFHAPNSQINPHLFSSLKNSKEVIFNGDYIDLNSISSFTKSNKKNLMQKIICFCKKIWVKK